MTTTFTPVPANKTEDLNLYNDPEHQWGSVDANAVFNAIRQLQTYLSSGVLDASITVTAQNAHVTLNSGPTVGPELDWIGYSGNWFCGIDVANAPSSRDMVSLGIRRTYSLADGVTTSGSPTLTSATHGGFVAAQVGAAISGAGIPAGTTIAAVGGTTSLTMSANATATASNVRVTITQGIVQDLFYWKHRGGLSPTCGIGVTPPDGSARLQVSPQDDEPGMGTIRLRVGPNQTGKALTLHDSAPADRFWIDKDFYVSGDHSLGGAIVLKGDATNNRPLLFIDKDLSASVYGFVFPAGGGGVLRFVRTTTSTSVFQVGTDGSLFIYNAVTMQSSLKIQGNVGFFNTNPAARPTVTGSRGGNAALASLLTGLASLGLITDSTSA